MHPEIAKTLVAQHRDELVKKTAKTGLILMTSDPARRLLPRWHVSWTRTVLALGRRAPVPAGGDRAGPSWAGAVRPW